jgi:hypothetical protein
MVLTGVGNPQRRYAVAGTAHVQAVSMNIRLGKAGWAGAARAVRLMEAVKAAVGRGYGRPRAWHMELRLGAASREQEKQSRMSVGGRNTPGRRLEEPTPRKPPIEPSAEKLARTRASFLKIYEQWRGLVSKGGAEQVMRKQGA